MAKRGLGKGLSALLSDKMPQMNPEGDNLVNVHIDLLEPGSQQPRKFFDEDALAELSASIKKNGLIQPVIVTQQEDSEKYSIIAGERRWRASKMAGLREVPVIIKKLQKKEALEHAIIENIQRQDLTPIEEAEAYQRLLEEFEYTQEDLAKVLGKSRSHVANILRLNTLPDSIKAKINGGSLSMGHARCLVGIEHAEEIAEQIIAKGLNVRQTEKLVKNWGSETTEKTTNSSSRAPKAKPVDDQDLIEIQNSISSSLGLKVRIEEMEDGGRVAITFHNLEELDRILQKLS